jgi:hypothetical protein
MAERNPNLMSPEAMKSMAQGGTGKPLFNEVLTKVNNAKVKSKKIEILKQSDSPGLRRILKGAFDPRIKWDLPVGKPPYMENEAPAGTEHTVLESESNKLWHFITGGDNTLSKTRKETLFIQILEGLHKDEAELLCHVKDKDLHTVYKGLTPAAVKEAYGWNDDFVKPE